MLIRPLDAPFEKENHQKDKEAVKEYVSIEPEERAVNIVSSLALDLSKYDPPNNIWTSEGFFCICPSSPPVVVVEEAPVQVVGPSAPAAVTNAAVNAAQSAAASARTSANVGK